MILSLHSKVIDKIQSGVARNIFFDIFKHPLWILSITFDWRLKITNGFLEMKLNLISQLFLVQRFLKKVILLCQNGHQSMLSSKTSNCKCICKKKIMFCSSNSKYVELVRVLSNKCEVSSSNPSDNRGGKAWLPEKSGQPKKVFCPKNSGSKKNFFFIFFLWPDQQKISTDFCWLLTGTTRPNQQKISTLLCWFGRWIF